MVRWFVWRWDGKPYKANPSKKIRLGYGSVLRIWYQWHRGGSQPEAIIARFGTNRKLDRKDVLAFARLCLAPDLVSIDKAWKRVANPVGTASAYRHELNPRLRKSLVRLFRLRRQVERETKQAGKILAALEAQP